MGILDGDAVSVVSSRHGGRGALVVSKSHKHRSRSRDRDRSRSRSRTRKPVITARSFFGLDNHSSSSKRHGSSSHHHHHSSSKHGGGSSNRSVASFFGMPNVSSRSVFSTFGFGSQAGHGHGGGSSFASYYRRSPRTSFLQRAYRKLKRLLRDLVYYAKRHPVRVFVLAVMPLLTGGALTALLARFGLRMPPSLERMLGMGARAMSGDSIGLVGDAVRMASGAGVSGPGRLGARSVLERRRDGGLQWERPSGSGGMFGESGGGGWGSSLGGIGKMFS